MFVSRVIAAAATCIALLAGPVAHAAPVDLNQWYVFGFEEQGGGLTEGSCCFGTLSIPAPDPAWTFTVVGDAALVVVDGFLFGDRFELFNFGTSLGVTSVPVIGGGCGADELACLVAGDNSVGIFALIAGSYAITGTVLASPFGSGAAFFIIRSSASPVPEPGSLALMLAGFIVLGFIRARRVP